MARMTRDVLWPRDLAWPPSRSFSPQTALAALQATTVSREEEILSYDSATRRTERRTELHHVPSPVWADIVARPELGPAEAWFYYSLLWKQPEVDLATMAKAEPPAKLLERVRADLADRSTSPWFDARAYWCCVTGLLSREDLARFVGDARVFVHSYKDGGASIITGYSERVAFIEAFYQVVVPYLDASERELVAREVGAIGPALLEDLSLELATQRMRVAAATGLFDTQLLAMLDAAAEASADVFSVLHAMRDPSHLATHAVRLKEYLLGELPLEKWLDRFGTQHASWIVTSLLAAPTSKVANPLVALLAQRLPADEAAPILEQLVDSKAGPKARAWLARHAKPAPRTAAAAGKRTPTKAAARRR